MAGLIARYRYQHKRILLPILGCEMHDSLVLGHARKTGRLFGNVDQGRQGHCVERTPFGERKTRNKFDTVLSWFINLLILLVEIGIAPLNAMDFMKRVKIPNSSNMH